MNNVIYKQVFTNTVAWIGVAVIGFIVASMVVALLPKSASAALDKAAAQSLLDEFVGNCSVGSPSGAGSRCLAIATTLTGELRCGSNTESGKALFRGNGRTITEILGGSVADCRAKIVDLPGQTSNEQTSARIEDAAQEACKQYDEQREQDSRGVSVYGACKEGYKAGYSGSKSRAEKCNEFTGKRRTACSEAYREGNNDSPGGNGNDPSTINSGISYDSLPQATANDNKLDVAANIAFGIAGSLAMLFVIIGGVRYIMSTGDSQKVSQAKNTILYALVGLIVTISAFAIVRFILTRVV
jgi:Type IV secretion system pilin